MVAVTAQIAGIACPTEAEGPGKRWAVWFQGCTIRCPGCCNPHLFSSDGGSTRTLDSLTSEIAKAKSDHSIEGITLLGGEPTEQLEAATGLATYARGLGLTVLAFTGKYLEQLLGDEASRGFLEQVDILVDGPYDQSKPEKTRRWIGSENQRIHLLTAKSAIPDPRWEMPNTIEISIRQGKVLVNGFPLDGHRNPLG